jgi:hypothetical protein
MIHLHSHLTTALQIRNPNSNIRIPSFKTRLGAGYPNSLTACTVGSAAPSYYLPVLTHCAAKERAAGCCAAAANAKSNCVRDCPQTWIFQRGGVDIAGASRARRDLEATTFIEKPLLDATLSSGWSHTLASFSTFSTWILHVRGESLRWRKKRIEIHIFGKFGISSAPVVLSMYRNFTSWRNSVFHMPDDSEQGYPTRNLRVSLRAENVRTQKPDDRDPSSQA